MNTTIIILVLFITIPILAIALFIEYKRRSYLNLLYAVVKVLSEDNLKEDGYKLLLSLFNNYKRKKYIWVPNQSDFLIDILHKHSREDLILLLFAKNVL